METPPNITIRVPMTPLSTPEWGLKKDGVNRAKHLWGILRNSVKLLTDLMKKDDVRPVTITHGIHHQRKLNHDEPIKCVIYNAITEEIITVDTQFIRVFYRDGRRKDIVDPGDRIDDMIWSSKSNQYVALTSDQQMKLLNSDLEFISTATFQYKISCMTCNETCNEIVTAGNGNIASWCFRYGNKYLIPHRVITEGLSPNDVFENITLEGSASKRQKCYASCGTGVAILNLHEGRLLVYKRDLHVRSITSILFVNPLKIIVTGSRDGSIKLWDSDFEVKHVFVGHHGPVQALALYPLGPYFMSASYDSTIRLWSLETYDEVDLLDTDEPNEGLNTVPELGHLFSFSSYAVDLWSISHIHQIFTSVGHDISSMELLAFPKIPERVLTQSSDNIIRIISPINGSVVTSVVPFHSFSSSRTKLNDEFSASGNLVDAVYCIPKETVYATYSDGSLVKAWTATNPATIQKVWKFVDDETINCLCIYEYLLDHAELLQTWKESQEKQKLPKQIDKRIVKYGNKSLLLVGQKDGCIANIDLNSGSVLFKTEAHGSKGVIGILANVKDDQVISAGEDNVVKIWRIFPNTAEALNLLMSFYCAHPPRRMAVVLSRLIVAFQQPETATYSIVVHDLETKERFDHSPDHDHTDSVTGLSCCPRLKLFASSSKDGTIRVWNNFNVLIRTLKLNAEPRSIQFCSQRGDLLVGLGGNVHRIEHQNYLPQAYIFKMVCMQFQDQIEENPTPFDDTILKHYSSSVTRCIKEAKSSYMKFDYAWDPMSTEELIEITEGEKAKTRAYAKLVKREKELTGIRDSQVPAKKKLRRATKRTEARAFKNYMQLFYRPQKKIQIAEPDDFTPDPLVEKPPTPMEWHEETKTGFFPPISAVKPMKEILEKTKEEEKEKHFTESGPDYEQPHKYIVNPTGFLPNSILAKFLWSQEDVAKQKEEMVYKPPHFTEEQMAEMNKKKEFALLHVLRCSKDLPSLSLGKRISLADVPMFEFSLATPSDEGSFWEDEERGWDVDDDVIGPSAGKPGDGKPTATKVERKPSKLMEKLQSAMKTPPPPPAPESPPPEAVPPEQKEKLQVLKMKQPTKPTKAIVKLVSKPPPPKAPTPPPPTPPPPKVKSPPATPPRTATPTPKFITQFEGNTWYEKYKDYIVQRTKRPYIAGQFCNVISDVIGIASDWDVRRSAVDAILLLWQQEDIVDTKHMVTAIMLILNSTNPPSPKDPDQASFLRSALKFLQAVLGVSEELILELLVQYLDSEATHKNFIKNILLQMGMRDSHNYLGKELETWEIWNLNETTSLKSQIKDLARRWLKEWTEKFKNHLEQVLSELKKGDLKATIRKPPETPQSVLKTGSSRASTQRGTPRVTFTLQATEQSLQNITPMEVINYFCEIALESELDRVRRTDSKPKPAKNTVLVLPKLEGPQALVRLGEMHTAHRARTRQELAAEYRLNPLARPYPDLMAGFASKIILPLSTMNMNPFPSPIDRFEMENVYQPVLLTLRSVHQRYFIPERSYVHLS